MGSQSDSVRSLGVANIRMVNSMSDVHGLWKYIAVCFHFGWTVLVPCTELGNIRVYECVTSGPIPTSPHRTPTAISVHTCSSCVLRNAGIRVKVATQREGGHTATEELHVPTPCG